MNADIRVYPDKEMKAVDMAEIVDSVQLANGIIQGCGVSIIQNALHINDGRILINGRLGVVTAGNIELPELEATTTCYLIAACDLAIENPFYIALLTGAEKSALDQKKSQIPNFNAGNGVDYVILGTASVNPTTHVVSNWTPQNASPVSNTTFIAQVRNALNNSITSVSNSLTTLSNKIGVTAMGTSATTVTGAIKELLTKINTTNTNLNTTNTNLSRTNTNLNTTNTNLNTQKGRIDTLVTKTAGFVKTLSYDVAANSNNYKQLNASSMYVLILNGGTASNTVRGIYLIGVTGSKVLGIKAISAATIAEVTDGGTGLLKVHNTGSVVLKATLITTHGS